RSHSSSAYSCVMTQTLPMFISKAFSVKRMEAFSMYLAFDSATSCSNALQVRRSLRRSMISTCFINSWRKTVGRERMSIEK
ncbi:hypothetical protein PENTCL1PPCAC_20459, partial [Pristionchus entomophagus]